MRLGLCSSWRLGRYKRTDATQGCRQVVLFIYGSQGRMILQFSCSGVIGLLLIGESFVWKQKAMPVKVRKQDNLPVKVCAVICLTSCVPFKAAFSRWLDCLLGRP